jgi:hypothetical protein
VSGRATRRNGSSGRGGRFTPRARTGRAIACAGLGLLALAYAVPAGAEAGQPAVRWSGARSDDGHLTGIVRLSADVTTPDPVEGWSLTIVSADGQPAFGEVCTDAFGRPRARFAVDCRWDTTRYPDQHLSPNRHYLVRLMTRQGEVSQPAGPDRPVALANLAQAPGGVELAYDRTSGKATLTWAPGDAPDMAHYDVEERLGRSPWTRVGEPTGTRFEREVTEPGKHQFRVAGERSGPDGQPVGPGDWAAPGTSADVPADARPGPDRDADTGKAPPARPEGRGSQGNGGGQHRERTASTPPAEKRRAAEPGASKRSDGSRRSGGSGRSARSGRSAGSADSAGPGDSAGPETGHQPSTGTTPAPSAVEGPPPADHSSVVFPESSNGAFASLSAPAVAGSPATPRSAGAAPVRPLRPATAPLVVAVEETDPGFQGALPYAAQEESADALAAPAAAPPSPAPPSPRRSADSGARRRAEGAGLVAIAAVLLGVTLRPRRQRPAPAAGISDGADARMEALEARLSELEARLVRGPGF